MDGIWVNEGPQPVVEGEVVTFTLTVPYASVSSGAHSAYKNGTDISSSCLSGAVSVSGNVITAKVFTANAGYGGSDIIHQIGADCDGQHLIFKISTPVSKPGQEY